MSTESSFNKSVVESTIIGWGIHEAARTGRLFASAWSAADSRDHAIEEGNFFLTLGEANEEIQRRRLASCLAVKPEEALILACRELVHHQGGVRTMGTFRSEEDWATYFRTFPGGFNFTPDLDGVWHVRLGPCGGRLNPIETRNLDPVEALLETYGLQHGFLLGVAAHRDTQQDWNFFELPAAAVQEACDDLARARRADRMEAQVAGLPNWDYLDWFGHFQPMGFMLEYADGLFVASVAGHEDARIFASSDHAWTAIMQLYFLLEGPCYAGGRPAKVGDAVSGTLPGIPHPITGVVIEVGRPSDPLAIAVCHATRRDFAPVVANMVFDTPPERMLSDVKDIAIEPYLFMGENLAIVRTNGVFARDPALDKPFIVGTHTVYGPASAFTWYPSGDTG